MNRYVQLSFLVYSCLFGVNTDLIAQGNIHQAGEGGVFTSERLALLKSDHGELGGLGNNPNMMKLYSDMRLKLAKMGEEVKLGLDDIAGTIYLDPEFQLGTLYYDGEAFKKLDLRYDAYNDEFEVKDSGSSSTVQALVKYSKLSCSLDGDTFKFTKFINKEEVEQEGYLVLVFEGDKYTLFERRIKRFIEGKPAKTSLGTSFPHRFVGDVEFYFAPTGGVPKHLKKKRSEISMALGAAQAGEVKNYIKANRIDLDSREDLVRLFAFTDNL